MTIPALFDLSGKTAIVTGSSRGIGKAIAHRLAEHGANVVISSRKAEACEAAVAEINEALGRKATIAVPANIASKADLQNLVDQTRKAFGQIDIVICNAAANPYFGPMSGIADEQFDKLLHNNIVSNHWLIQMVAPEMIERRDGSIIIISSIAGLVGSQHLGGYAITKAADMQLARNLAAEFGEKGVRVNAICPGLVKTDFARSLWDNPEILKQATAGSCLKRIGQPDEIAGMAVYLASPAGAFTTGQSFAIDGGATIV